MQKVALIQMSSSKDKTANVAKAIHFINTAIGQHAKIIVLPEVFSYRADIQEKANRLNVAETIPGITVETFATIARLKSVWIILGSLFEKAFGDKVYNTSVVINPAGKIVQKYRKIHLFDAVIGDKMFKESNYLLPGKDPAIFDLEDFRVGLSICYDVRFSDLYAQYRELKTDVICIPSCFTHKTGQAHWEVLVRARAIENLSYVLAPNQVGEDERHVKAFGNSMMVNPWGEIIAKASENAEEIIYGTIDRRCITEARVILPGIV